VRFLTVRCVRVCYRSCLWTWAYAHRKGVLSLTLAWGSVGFNWVPFVYGTIDGMGADSSAPRGGNTGCIRAVLYGLYIQYERSFTIIYLPFLSAFNLGVTIQLSGGAAPASYGASSGTLAEPLNP
jgi:hypothetical protein